MTSSLPEPCFMELGALELAVIHKFRIELAVVNLKLTIGFCKFLEFAWYG